jgi:hypothetical protein
MTIRRALRKRGVWPTAVVWALLTTGCGSWFLECPEPVDLGIPDGTCAGEAAGLCGDPSSQNELALCEPGPFTLEVDRSSRTVTRRYRSADGREVAETWDIVN